MGASTRLKKFSGGITFMGRFANQTDAQKMIGELEKIMTVDLGLSLCGGGIAETGKPVCDCDHASECDERVGCLFVPWEIEDEESD
jgi:hypothetical protein